MFHRHPLSSTRRTLAYSKLRHHLTLRLSQNRHCSNHPTPQPSSAIYEPIPKSIPTTPQTKVGSQPQGKFLSAIMRGPSAPLIQTRLNVLAGTFTPSGSSKTTLQIPIESKPKKGIKRKSKAFRYAALVSEDSSTDQSLKHHQRSRQPPSKLSGGIPSPSTLYLTQALPPPTTLPNPRRILVILDLNGTLLFRPSRRHPSRFVQRPHAHHFLDYCLNTFYLAIWSSARPQNVNGMVAQLLTPEQRTKCVMIWARDKLGLSKDDYDARVQVYKRLTEVWNDPQVRASHPQADIGGCWDQSNTVLVDDSFEKGRSEPHNILPIPEFSGLDVEPPNVLPQVHDYLNELCYQADVSRYMRETPFNLNPGYRLPNEL